MCWLPKLERHTNTWFYFLIVIMENSGQNAKVAQKSPYAVEVEAEKKYFWCSCGVSQNQPFCDGSHKGGDFSPIMQTFEEAKTVYFCGCKATSNPPFCDGSHNQL